MAHRGVSCDCWGNPPTGPTGSGWLQDGIQFPKSLEVVDDLCFLKKKQIDRLMRFYLMLGNHDFRDFTLIVFGFYDDL